MKFIQALLGVVGWSWKTPAEFPLLDYILIFQFLEVLKKISQELELFVCVFIGLSIRGIRFKKSHCVNEVLRVWPALRIAWQLVVKHNSFLGLAVYRLHLGWLKDNSQSFSILFLFLALICGY